MKIDFFAGIEVDDAVYFSAWNVNGMFKMDRNTGNITYIGCAENEKMDHALHYHVFKHQKKLYFIPGYGDCIAVLDVKDLSIRTITLPEREHICQTNKFAEIVHVENDLWLIPVGYDAVLRLDLETEKLEVFDNWPEGVTWESEVSMQFNSAIYVSGHICMLPRESKFFVTFDVKNKKMQKWDWKYPEFAFDAMVFQNECIWFLPRVDYPYIVKYSIEKKEEELIELKEEIQDEVLCLYCLPLVIDNKIIRAPYQSEYWFILDTNTNQISKIKSASSEYPMFQKLTIWKDGLLATSGIRGKGEYLSKDLEKIEEIIFEVREVASYLQDRMKSCGKSEVIFKEEKFMLQAYLKAITSVEKNIAGLERITNGREIYAKLVE